MDPSLILPHRPPVLAVTHVLSADPDGGRVACRVPRDWSLLVEGRAPATLAIEILSQACAAWAAGDGGPGVLLRVRGMALHTASLPIDVPLTAELRRTDGTDHRMAAFAVALRADDHLLAEGSLLVQRLSP